MENEEETSVAPARSRSDQCQRWDGAVDSKFIFLKREITLPNIEKYFILCLTFW